MEIEPRSALLGNRLIVAMVEADGEKFKLFAPTDTLREIMEWAWKANRRYLPGVVTIRLAAVDDPPPIPK